jgi:hypothetical protein
MFPTVIKTKQPKIQKAHASGREIPTTKAGMLAMRRQVHEKRKTEHGLDSYWVGFMDALLLHQIHQSSCCGLM